jgi:subtilisin family serine protease
VKVGVSDTGLVAGAAGEHSWLADVTGDLDALGPVLPDGRSLIGEYDAHGTFIAGVVRTMASDTDVHVVNHFTAGGAVLETEVINSLEALISGFAPDIVSLSAGGYTRNDWEPLSFAGFRAAHPDVTLVAAAGNESTDRPFYPAALDWVIGVGALATDQTHRAWFSNYGPWVDVYALGEGMVNAYATGTYQYQEPPRRPAAQNFDGMARWDGTSFATPLVAGLIAARMAANPNETSAQAAAAVLAGAVPLAGVGPALTV